MSNLFVFKCLVFPLFPESNSPCGAHGPRHIQQNSKRQAKFLHVMWLQPPSFSMVTLNKKNSFSSLHQKYPNMAFRAILGVCIQPIRRLTVIRAFLQPSPEHIACDRLVPLVYTFEAEDEATMAYDFAWLGMGHFYGTTALRGTAPFDEVVALK
jgi:hypothetical protein